MLTLYFLTTKGEYGNMEMKNEIIEKKDRHYDYGCCYSEGGAKNSEFEFFIYNKKNNKIRSRVKLDERPASELAGSLISFLGGHLD